jgi:hypothetical protein
MAPPHSTFSISHSTFPSREGGGMNPWMQYLVWPLVKFLVAFIIVADLVALIGTIDIVLGEVDR